RDAMLAVVAHLQEHFELPVESLKFHKHLAETNCPGESLDYNDILGEVRRSREAIRHDDKGAKRTASRRPLGSKALEIRAHVEEVLQAFRDQQVAGDNEPDAEPDEGSTRVIEIALSRATTATQASPGAKQSRGLFDRRLTPQDKERLRPHVVNLNNGAFAASGQYETSPSDVDAIFNEHLKRALNEVQARGEKLRLMIYAHGGLTTESSGLAMASGLISWWKANGIYPIYFVWETGFWGTLGQMVKSWWQGTRAVTRDLADFTSDPVIELAAQQLGGVKVWSGMKRSAELAVDADGGARYVAERLAKFCQQHGDDVELYAVGHSAGSIFHSHFIPTAKALGVPPFEAAYFLAPAIRVDEFQQRLAPLVGKGKGIERLSMFTMSKDWEKDDNCFDLYRKSLLYLIYYGLEPERKTPILGLDESLRNDPALRKMFGLNGAASNVGDVVWAKSTATTGRNASQSTTHGGFDNDPATMESVVRRILNRDEIQKFPQEMSERSFAPADDLDLPEDLAELAAALGRGAASDSSFGSQTFEPPRDTRAVSAALHRASGIAASAAARPVRVGRRRALCVGIDEYRQSPLHGCVHDAKTWATTLERLGFSIETLLNRDATHANILEALSKLVRSSNSGDIVVFQYAGHGTTLPDLDGDEAGGDTPGQDEAFVPYDYDRGAFLIDDDIAMAFRRIPAGVNMTCFIDCCHSGTITRLLIGVRPHDSDADERPRFMIADQAMIQSHQQFRSTQTARAVMPPRDPESMTEVLFSACRSDEVAWESSGQGEFTLRATRLLSQGIGGLTHEQFQRGVVQAFGASPRQHPQLDCASKARGRTLLQPLAGGNRDSSELPEEAESAGHGTVQCPAASTGDLSAVAHGLRAFANVLERRP
ncbi:MAG: caspase family protein, partial [Planctomycetota bacterium]